MERRTVVSSTAILMAFAEHDEKKYLAKDHRGLLEQACLFAACGKDTDWIVRHAAIDLGLFADGCKGLTALGKDFLLEAFYTTELDG